MKARFLGLGAAVAVGMTFHCAPVVAENFVGIYGGYQFGAQGTDLKAQEDLNYTGSTPHRHPATGSDLSLEDSPTVGLRIGRYFESIRGLGLEGEFQYSQPNFKNQNVTVTLTDGTKIGGYSAFTENQLPADFYMLMGGLNLLYRYDGFERFKPYVGAGPAIFGLGLHGSGNSCNIVAPAPLVRGFCDGGEMVSDGIGVGLNAKAGFEIPISSWISIDAEYKFSYGSMDVNWFRSFSSITVDYEAHNVTTGLRLKF